MNIEMDAANKQYAEALQHQNDAALFNLTQQIIAASFRLQAAQDELEGLIAQWQALNEKGKR